MHCHLVAHVPLRIFALQHFKRVSYSLRFENTTIIGLTGCHMAFDCCFFRTCFHGHSVDPAVLSPSHVSTFQRAMATIPDCGNRRILDKASRTRSILEPFRRMYRNGYPRAKCVVVPETRERSSTFIFLPVASCPTHIPRLHCTYSMC